MSKLNGTDVTFIIPLRIESLERLENVVAVVNAIDTDLETKVIIIEADKQPNTLLPKLLPPNVEYRFVEDGDKIFHRTKYLNIVSRDIDTTYAAIWDSDVIVHRNQIVFGLDMLRNGNADFVFPYDGVFVDTGIAPRSAYLQSGSYSTLLSGLSQMMPLYGMSASGGGFLVNMSVYRDSGLENENFYGWGPEDGERVKRMLILGRNVRRVGGPMFHLSHPRGVNSGRRSDDDQIAGLREFLRIVQMSTRELQQEVKTWHKNGNV